ncbi:MAG: DUF349 domain-containing protein [Bacteroidetes bacterium]|nr:DUF349 domain-containing protein [Bacteroidota bacterium]
MPSDMMEHDQNPHEGSAHEVPSQDLEATTLETATAEPSEVTEVPEAPESADLAESAPEVAEVPAPVVTDSTEEPAEEPVAEESEDHTEEEREAHEDHSADYSELSDDELIAEAARVLREVPIAEARVPMLALRNTLLPRLDEVRQAALEAFVAEGGNALDFHFEQKARERFYETYNEFKKRRGAWKAEQERALAVNLDVKRAIVDELKKLAESEELPSRATYNNFKKVFDRWKEVGPVPAEDARDLNATFRFLVDRFYDNLRLSQELRELDYKVNKEAKELLIRAVQELSAKNWSASVGGELQRIHTAWKEIGPVSLEDKEPLWEQFKAASSILHEKRREKFEEQKAQNSVRLEAKALKVAEAEALKERAPKSHQAWQNATEKLNELRGELGKIGRTFGGPSDELWSRFKAVERWAYKERNVFYRERKKNLKSALDVKLAIVEKAEALAQRNDFGAAAKEMKQLQQEWKDSGFAPKKQTDELWARFRAAGNSFFDGMRGAQGEERTVRQVAQRKMQGMQSARQTVELARRKLAQMENNMGFFQFAKPDSPIVQDALNKVDQARRELEAAEKAFRSMQQAERAKTADSLAPEAPASSAEESASDNA